MLFTYGQEGVSCLLPCPTKTATLLALSFYLTQVQIIIWQIDGDENFEKLKDEASILQFFQKYFHDALKMMPNLIEQFLANPIGSLCTIKVWPWHYKDYAVLIGDAGTSHLILWAHSIVPFYG
jgi:kynurenine 3-monooxygenase